MIFKNQTDLQMFNGWKCIQQICQTLGYKQCDIQCEQKTILLLLFFCFVSLF